MVDAGGSDNHWNHGFNGARRTADMLAEYGVKWFEEPLSPDALEDFVALRAASPVLISVQPDVTKSVGSANNGGWAGQRRITPCS